MPPPITVLFADDHPAWRRTVRFLLEQAPDIRIVGEAEDGLQAIDRLQALRPDVAVLDLDMPHKDGLAVVQAVRDLHLPTRTLLLTVLASRTVLERARGCGAAGYVLKDDAATQLLACVRTVHAGSTCFSPRVLPVPAA